MSALVKSDHQGAKMFHYQRYREKQPDASEFNALLKNDFVTLIHTYNQKTKQTKITVGWLECGVRYLNTFEYAPFTSGWGFAIPGNSIQIDYAAQEMTDDIGECMNARLIYLSKERYAEFSTMMRNHPSSEKRDSYVATLLERPVYVYFQSQDCKPNHPRLGLSSLQTQTIMQTGISVAAFEAIHEQFIALIAIEIEDNQNKAEALLNEHPRLAPLLISAQRGLRDAAGRQFCNSMSAYEYAYWSGDTRMRHMLEKYMDDETKAIVDMQCKRIAEQGLDFTLNGERVSNSKCFDYQPLLMAYQQYTWAEDLLHKCESLPKDWWDCLGERWLKIGAEQAKVPTCVAQEYCSGRMFSHLEQYKKSLELDVSRRSALFFLYSDSDEHKHKQGWNAWFSDTGAHPDLGVSCSIYNSEAILPRAQSAGIPRDVITGNADKCFKDLAAVTALCQKRTIIDLQQTLTDLLPVEHGSESSMRLK